VNKWGFFSDILSGPFYSHGVDADNPELFKTTNGVKTKVSV
jgi:hypothetical protein